MPIKQKNKRCVQPKLEHFKIPMPTKYISRKRGYNVFENYEMYSRINEKM